MFAVEYEEFTAFFFSLLKINAARGRRWSRDVTLIAGDRVRNGGTLESETVTMSACRHSLHDGSILSGGITDQQPLLWYQHVTARTQPDTGYVLRHSDRDNATVITYRHLCQDHGEREIPDVTSMRRSNYSVPYQPVSERNFTLVMVTHERDRLLKTLLRRYSTMTNIASIIVYWNNPRRTPPDLTKDMDFRMPLVIVELSMTSLRLRYQPLPEIRTNG